MSNNIVDKNFEIKTAINLPDVKFYDVRSEPFEIYGLYRAKTEPQFKRMPDEIAGKMNANIQRLYLNTAGGRVRFCTDSAYVAIHAEFTEVGRHSHMTLANDAGFDLYEDSPTDGSSRYVKAFLPPYNITDSYESKIDLNGRKLRYFTINFPPYSSVKNLYIGLQADAFAGEGAKYRNKRPVLYYGSSITQGACASRPGNIYENMISRSLGIDYINLGFSGNGRAEDVIVDYMNTIDMSVFVADYDHNAPNAEYLEKTALNMYKKIRAGHPDVPYIMLSRPDFDADYDQSVLRRNAVINVYRYAREQGDDNVYYIDGEGIFRGDFEDSCTVDKVHPNDLGFAYMSKAIECEIKRAMVKKSILD
ncbi:MAG: hypothetical protein IJ038_03130 [Clostridia bacterium]|nr:hypothetical protein [Clostridia bacterium]